MATTLLNKNNSVQNYGGSYIGYYFYLEVILNSQSIPNNTSNITVNHYGQANTSTGGGYSGYSSPTSVITVNGSQKRSGQCDANIPTSGTKTLIGTWTGDVSHNSDGSLSLNVSAAYAPNATVSYLPQANTLSGTAESSVIPRASTISVSDYTITNTSGSLSFTIQSKASFYHKVVWTLNGSSTTVNYTTAIDGNSTKTIANTDLLTAMDNVTSAQLTLKLSTYTDSGLTNLTGTTTATCTVSINTANFKPAIALTVGRNTSPTGITSLVAGYSTAKVVWNRTIGYGATDATVYFSINYVTLSANSATGSGGQLTTSTLPSSKIGYFLTASAYAIDSRGIKSDTVTATASVYGYQRPSGSLIAKRVVANNDPTEDPAGTWAYVKWSGSVKTNIGGQNNQVTRECVLTGDISETMSSTEAWYALGVDETLTATLTVADKIASTVIVKTIGSAAFPLDLYDEGDGTVGVGLGSYAEPDLIKMGLDTQFRYDKNLELLTSGGSTVTIPASYFFGYQNNETVSITSSKVMLVGNITGSTKTLNFFIPLDKSLYNISSCTVTNMEIAIRGIAGNVDGSGSGKEYEGATGYTVSATVNKVNRGIYVSITNTTEFTNATNNTPVAIAPTKINLTLTS